MQSRSWSLPRPWTNSNGMSMPGPSIPGPSQWNRRGEISTQPYMTFLKRSIPFVSLCLDNTNRNIAVDSTINNVYIKIPDSSVSAQSILSALATKIGCEANDLVMLDVKFLEITDDKDLEYWKMPSRRFYAARRQEYEDILKSKSRKRLSLKGKKKLISYAYAEDPRDTDEDEFGFRVERKLQKIEDDLKAHISDNEELKQYKLAKQEMLKELECKICKEVPSGLKSFLLCCNQIIGCENCLVLCLRENPVCPLCRAQSPSSVVVNGMNSLYSFFSGN